MSPVSVVVEMIRVSVDRGQVAVGLSAVVTSTAGLLQRQLSSVPVATQVGGRALFAAVTVAVYVMVTERGRVIEACRSVGGAGVGFATCLAVSSATFTVALNDASVARVLVILAIAPVLAALLGFVVLSERLTVRTMIAMAVALLGVGVMLGSPGGGSALGDGLSFIMAFGFAGAIVIARHRRDVSMAPATGLAQLMVLIVAAPVALVGGVAVAVPDVLWLVLFGAGQIGLGLILLTIGARLVTAAQVALIFLLEIVLGPAWVWLAVGERPGVATAIGGAVVVAAVILQARNATERRGTGSADAKHSHL
jgi:drug/metabolite transporter (DMT)-like permease